MFFIYTVLLFAIPYIFEKSNLSWQYFTLVEIATYFIIKLFLYLFKKYCFIKALNLENILSLSLLKLKLNLSTNDLRYAESIVFNWWVGKELDDRIEISKNLNFRITHRNEYLNQVLPVLKRIKIKNKCNYISKKIHNKIKIIKSNNINSSSTINKITKLEDKLHYLSKINAEANQYIRNIINEKLKKLEKLELYKPFTQSKQNKTIKKAVKKDSDNIIVKKEKKNISEYDKYLETKQFLTTRETAAYLTYYGYAISETTLNQYRSNNKGYCPNFVKRNTKVLYNIETLRQFLKDNLSKELHNTIQQI